MNLAGLQPSAPRGVDLSRVRALIVDENVTARQALRNLLGACGIEQVQQAGDPIRAIRLMEQERFGLVLCELKFRTQMDGLQVLEYVRTRRLLEPSAAFVLVSGEADRGSVAAAREWQPDGFLLKPLSAGTLAPRIEQALRRRTLLAPVYSAAERGDPLAVLTFAERVAGPAAEGASLELMRWRAQALVDLGRFDEARALAERALSIREDLPWAELALAHADRADGQAQRACERLDATIRAHPFFGGAYDLLIEILQQQGRTAKALAVARAALEQIATSRRTRTLGELAYAHGELDLAERCYADLIRKTSASLTRSALDVGMLGQVFVGQGESDKALRLVANADLEMAGDAPSQALAASVQAQAHAARGDTAEAQAAARRALAFAATVAPPESVALLVARGAFSAGLPDEAEALVRRTMAARAQPGPAGALARKVIDEAGLDPGSFGIVPPETIVPDDDDAEAGRADAHRPRGRAADAGPDGESYMRNRAGPGVGRGERDAGTAPAGDAGAAASAELALAALRRGRFDEATLHVGRARDAGPDDPAVLMASVQVHLARMRAQGFEAAAAAEVRRCLAEIDRQIPGDERVFAELAPDGQGASSSARYSAA
jgi:tetratricopeptide (TPR) repeat protein